MTTELCRGRPSEWWWTGDDGNRLATMICRRCTSCPDDDPSPHGVIRRGVAYSNAGRPLPPCPSCDAPNTSYRGGAVRPCDRCAVPNVPIPDLAGSREAQIAGSVARGLTDRQIGAQLGLEAETVRKLRRTYGIRRRPAQVAMPS
ncbi:hypothetical protein Ade02nite_19160 [Paractinoplanes deccanensis]|uniref:HTH luxR-type domain-containing protein n=1 Tax=Paractinoplanes deccanensis TaxID=113561 RepID=A0ABQ3Y093_9ACTN|nr:hypothetical protein [Actinoplanes deccanensis]GID73275.1 hypothetical protein Ade02nite_19160 [Actinoplanes deccanensis]